MTDSIHIRGFRLFDLALARSAGKAFELSDEEQQHLETCAECRGLSDFFTGQVTARPVLYNNGDVNSTDGWYKNICCGIEVFVQAGKIFPDCRRHKNLPTSWKRSHDDSNPLANKQSA
jgi:hypothetical protein